METMKEYLRELRELLAVRDEAVTNKGKTLIGGPSSPSHSTSVKTTTPSPLCTTEEPKQVEIERELREEGNENTGRVREEVMHHHLELPVFIREDLVG